MADAAMDRGLDDGNQMTAQIDPFWERINTAIITYAVAAAKGKFNTVPSVLCANSPALFSGQLIVLL